MKNCIHCDKQIANNSKKCKYCGKSQEVKTKKELNTKKEVKSENKKALEYVESTKMDYIKRILLFIVYIILSYFIASNINWLMESTEEALYSTFVVLIIYEIISLIKDLKKLANDTYETKKTDFSKHYYKMQILGRFIAISLILLVGYYSCMIDNYSNLTDGLFMSWLISTVLILGADFIYNYFIYPNDCNTLRSTRPSMLALMCFTWAMEGSIHSHFAFMPILLAFGVFIIIKVLARLCYYAYNKIKNK